MSFSVPSYILPKIEMTSFTCMNIRDSPCSHFYHSHTNLPYLIPALKWELLKSAGEFFLQNEERTGGYLTMQLKLEGHFWPEHTIHIRRHAEIMSHSSRVPASSDYGIIILSSSSSLSLSLPTQHNNLHSSLGWVILKSQNSKLPSHTPVHFHLLRHIRLRANDWWVYLIKEREREKKMVFGVLVTFLVRFCMSYRLELRL